MQHNIIRSYIRLISLSSGCSKKKYINGRLAANKFHDNRAKVAKINCQWAQLGETVLISFRNFESVFRREYVFSIICFCALPQLPVVACSCHSAVTTSHEYHVLIAG